MKFESLKYDDRRHHEEFLILCFNCDKFYRYVTLLEIAIVNSITPITWKEIWENAPTFQSGVNAMLQMETLQYKWYLVGTRANHAFNVRAQLFVPLKETSRFIKVFTKQVAVK